MNKFIADVHENINKAGDMYDFTDYGKIRGKIFESVKSAIGRRFPLENERHRLEVVDVHYPKNLQYTKKEQKDAILEGRSLTQPLKGKWRLVDKATGEVLSKTNTKILASVPYMTERGTFIRNGTETVIPVQARLVSGVYTRIKDNDEVEAHVNVKPGSGRLFKVFMRPDNSVFYLKQGTRNIKLYPLLKTLGVNDQTIKQSWGKNVYKANIEASTGSDVTKGLRSLLPPLMDKKVDVTPDAGSGQEKTAAETEEQQFMNADETDRLKELFSRMELDPISTEHTLGKPYSRVTPETLLRTTGKIIRVARHEQDPDARDSLLNQRFYNAPDIMAEHILKDAGSVGRQLLWKISNKGDATKIPTGVFNKYIDGVFNKSRIPQVLEEINPLEVYQRMTAVTKMGEGGISDVRAAPSSARLVQNTYRGFIDPVQTSESLKVGLTNQMAYGVKKGENGLLYTPLMNRGTGKTEWVNTIKASQLPVLVPGGYKKGDKLATVMVGDSIEYMNPREIQYEMPDGDSMFALTSNMVPFKSNVHAQRLLMGAKHNTQALSLTKRESPLVRTKLPGGRSSENIAGEIVGAVRAPKAGVVIKATPSKLTVKYQDGATDDIDLYNNFPFNRKTYLRNTLNVKTGDRFRKGQALAGTNYTDPDGNAALGTNMRVAYMVHHGKNYRDAAIVSESGAKKLTSEHMYSSKLADEKDITVDRKTYMSMYPGKFNEKQYKTVGDNGVARPGTVLHKGDPIILSYRENPATTGTMNRRTFSDKALTWQHPFPGVITDVAKNKNGHVALIRANVPAQQGDKLAGRFGNKSVIAEVVPDSEMPQDKDGKAMDVVMSPLGVVSRLNDGQVYEALLGKVAAKRGEAYELPGFLDQHSADFVEAELKKYGLTEGEDLKDPISGKTAKDVTTGVTHVLKLHHTAEGKGSQRSTGAYTQDEQPATGGKSGAKTLGNLVLSAVVAHDALDVLKDMKLVKGQKNDDFWRDFQLGKNPAMPGTPLVYDKFLAHIQGAGIKLNKEGNTTNIFGMTESDAKSLTGNHKITTSDTYNAKSLRPIAGGLFDPDIFGPNGTNWGYISSPFKIPNPVMEDSIKHILGLTGKQYTAALEGNHPIKGEEGPNAIEKALKKVNVVTEMEAAANEIKFGAKSKRDKAIKKYRALFAMSKHDVKPEDFMLTRIPVLPPKYRPITAGGDLTMVADANYMYKNLIDDIKDYDDAQAAGIPDTHIGGQRNKIYDSFKQLVGLTAPEHGKLKEKNVGGLLKWIFGKGSPKNGAFQRRVISTALDVSGRSVVTPNSSLKLNEVGMPETQAWDLYEKFVVRKMVQNGYDATIAAKMVAEKSPTAKSILEEVVSERPLIMTRAPALHKYSVMGVWPKLTKGHTLQVPVPLVHPFNMDYDGDTSSFYVPVSDDAVKETIEKMMPEKNLLSARKFKAHYLPEEEYRLGMFLASRTKKQKPTKRFKTQKEAIQAYKQGTLAVDEPVVIG